MPKEEPTRGGRRIRAQNGRSKVRSAQCGNYGNLLSHFFGKNFVKVTILPINSWFDEIFHFPKCVFPEISYLHANSVKLNELIDLVETK